MAQRRKPSPTSTLKVLSLKKGKPTLSKGRPMDRQDNRTTGWTRPRNQMDR